MLTVILETNKIETNKSDFVARAFAALIAVCIWLPVCQSATAQDAPTNFDDNVKAVFKQRCASCHGPDSREGDLDVTNFTNLMQGGSSGTVIEPGDVDGSYLFNLITHEDEPVMPPGGKIPDAEIELVRKWIELGALENKGSKAVIKKKIGAAMGENPLIRPEVVANWPRMPLEPVQHTDRNPVATSIATSPWATVAAVAGRNQVLLYDTGTLELVGVLPFPEGTVNVVRFSRSGAVLLAAGGRSGSSGIAVLWDVSTGERITTIGDELDAVLAADISPDHSLVALGGAGRVISIYSTSTGELKHRIEKHTDWITALAFSTDGVLLATGDRNGGLHVWESWTAREYLTLKGHSAAINSIAWRADSNAVASGSGDTTIRLWELNNGAQIKSWNAHGGGTKSIAFTREGLIVSNGVDKTPKLWAQDGAQQKTFAAFADIGMAVAWCDETGRAIAGDYTGEIRVWNSTDASQVGALSPNPTTIAARLAAAQTQLTEATSKVEPLDVASRQATDAATTAQTELDAAVAANNAAQVAFDEVQTAMAAINEKANQLKAQLDIATQQLAEFSAAKPLLAEALAKMKEAAAKLPKDTALQQQVTELTGRLQTLDTQIATTQTEATTTEATFTEITSQARATDDRLKTSTENLKSTAEMLAAAEAKLPPLVAARDAALAELEAARAAVASAQTNVDRWLGEQAFIAQLNALKARLAEAENVVVQQHELLEAANAELTAAQEKSASAAASVGSARKSVEAIQAEIETARKIER